LALVEQGLPIVICEEKSPLGTKWQDHKWSPAQITEVLEAMPEYNVGLILGERSRIVDIEGDDENSEAEFLELFDGNEPLTWKYKSKRGFHRFFKYDTRLEANDKAVTKWKTLEIR